MKAHHIAWLAAHPHRSEAWLRERLADRFDVHHLDGNHENNDPLNLVLIESADHLMLHGGRALRRIGSASSGRKGRWLDLADGKAIRLWRGERKSRALAEIAAGNSVYLRRVVAV